MDIVDYDQGFIPLPYPNSSSTNTQKNVKIYPTEEPANGSSPDMSPSSSRKNSHARAGNNGGAATTSLGIAATGTGTHDGSPNSRINVKPVGRFSRKGDHEEGRGSTRLLNDEEKGSHVRIHSDADALGKKIDLPPGKRSSKVSASDKPVSPRSPSQGSSN